jgi:hypothetical protein
MRLSRPAMLVCAAIAALTSADQPAAAEGFFKKLFGWGSSRRSERIAPPTFNFGFGGQQLDYGRGYGQGYGDSGFPQDYTKYRTLCVRTCDGFYFPIGDSVGRERLYNDARTCSARCDGEAKLFYYPTNGGSVDTMVDMAGRPYAQLPTAFLYRKTLVQGCTCKPAPWSAETAARHQGYKDEAAALAEMRSSSGRRYAGQAVEAAEGWQGDGGGEIEAYLQRESDGPQQTPWAGGVRRY